MIKMQSLIIHLIDRKFHIHDFSIIHAILLVGDLTDVLAVEECFYFIDVWSQSSYVCITWYKIILGKYWDVFISINWWVSG